MKTKIIDASVLRAALLDGNEIAVIDVRELGAYGHDHLLLAVNIPLSRIDLVIGDFVPRLTIRVVLCDADEKLAWRAAGILDKAGYTDLAILKGGVAGWLDAGFELFSGDNVPSKAFGEYVEHHFGTPNISAEELKSKVDAGEDLVILDSRPLAEYQNMSIPGGIDAEGAELVHRVRSEVPDSKTLVVVNCAGRTRSIIGCQSLVNAGLENPVVALKNGTMGWHLAGFELDHGADRVAGEVSVPALDWAKNAAARVSKRFGVRTIDRETLASWHAEANDRTLYVLDVRLPGEYEAGHLPGSRSAPGGQLVQATDRYLATRHARIVLVDDNGVRATMTASWLIQLGWADAVVLKDGLEDGNLERGPHVPLLPEFDATKVAELEVGELQQRLESGTAVVVDFADSRTYRAGHIPAARWTARSRIHQLIGFLPPAEVYIATAPNEGLAQRAASEMVKMTSTPIAYLKGGNAAWVDAGLPQSTGAEFPIGPVDDVYERPYDREKGIEEAMQQYLDWELALVEQIERDGTLKLPHFPP
jgi:rhodanese-related sulfurtransferase